MFAIGYLYGFHIGKTIGNITTDKIAPSPKTLELRKRIFTFLEKNPNTTCREIAEGISESIPRVNGILTGMVKKEPYK